MTYILMGKIKEKMETRKKNEFSKEIIGKPKQWIVDSAKEVGVDIEGYSHEKTSDFKNHVQNRHGNQKIETSRGQIAINEKDFEKIPEIIESPVHVIIGGKYTKGEDKGKDFLVYAKKMDDDTMFYYEVVLSGQKTLRGKTMYKQKGKLDKQAVFDKVSSSQDADYKKAKIISPEPLEASPA